MAPSNDIMTDVPGTVYLVDASGSLDAARSGRDILLVPQPTPSQADPLNWPKYKKYWSLFLISAYACIMSFGENNWGAAWTTISEETGVTLNNMNGGSALNYLLLGFVNIIWIPSAMKFGRKIVYILSLLFILAGGVWGGFFEGTAQYYLMMVVTGIGTAAYQALIQLTAILILLFIFTFDDTMFPRYRFRNQTSTEPSKHEKTAQPSPTKDEKDQKPDPNLTITASHSAGEISMPPRTYLQQLAPIHYFKDDQTTWFQYFRRPFYLFLFPNIVLAGIQFAFGCTAGIVSFNTISEIMTEPPYNWSAGSAGLLFLAALVGNFIGMAIGSLSDYLVLTLTRRNKGYKEPEMRLYAYIFSLPLAAVGYFTYGWGATAGSHWMAIAVGLCCMIAQQVSATSIATAYAMECFDQISGELVIVLAICSSVINFAISFSVQNFIDATSYGWTFTFYGIWVILSMVMGAPMIVWGKSWRRRCKGRYEAFLAEMR
ncbi:hypothetical protein SI65_07918 [Aspergillus cristatus]|uniref:Major facilitator superfamily (MFS) profile domain-containing protein n=1 Tax=Aspergillus cristatus TaxID=573508 RepID=A0A1E3B6I5_ASPCR|nr:hypothetical protein SI65_07918 [Aspergillus cristatus]